MVEDEGLKVSELARSGGLVGHLEGIKIGSILRLQCEQKEFDGSQQVIEDPYLKPMDLTWRSDTGSHSLHSKVYRTKLRSAMYSRFGAATGQASRVSRSNALSASMSDRMVDERWVWRGKAALNVNRSSDLDSGKKDWVGRTSSQLSSLKPYSLIRIEKCSSMGCRQLEIACCEEGVEIEIARCEEGGEIEIVRCEEGVEIEHAIAVDVRMETANARCMCGNKLVGGRLRSHPVCA